MSFIQTVLREWSDLICEDLQRNVTLYIDVGFRCVKTKSYVL
jgi:hypothetical protein